MEKEKALLIWEAIYGKEVLWITDCFGTWMYKEDYGDIDKKRIRPKGDGKLHTYGWEIDHIRPKDSYQNEKEANFLNNYEPMHWKNNRDKTNSFPHFVINNNKYRIVKCNICSGHGFKGYGIINENGERVDWKGIRNEYFATND